MIGIGTDLVELDRFRLALQRTPRLPERLFSDAERAYAARRRDPTERLAARFAAKEATIKALGSRRPALHEIEVVRSGDRRPRLRLRGRAAQVARELGVRQVALSLSHGQEHAVAVVVLLRAGEPTPPCD